MRFFKNLNVDELFMSIDNVSMVSYLYSQGLNTQNPILAICAQNELIRRNCFDIVKSVLINYLNDAEDFQVGSTFSKILAESLMDIENLEPTLGLVGHKLENHSSPEEATMVDEKINDKATLVATLRTLIKDHKFTDVEFYRIAQDMFDAST